jgi:hypothetical protein
MTTRIVLGKRRGEAILGIACFLDSPTWNLVADFHVGNAEPESAV